jgi:hypothetical protein
MAICAAWVVATDVVKSIAASANTLNMARFRTPLKTLKEKQEGYRDAKRDDDSSSRRKS